MSQGEPTVSAELQQMNIVPIIPELDTIDDPTMRQTQVIQEDDVQTTATEQEMGYRPTAVGVTRVQQTNKREMTLEERHKKGMGIYMLQIIHRKISVDFTMVGSNISEVLQKKLIENLEGKCAIEGFIKNNSIRIINYSAGIIKSNKVIFDVIFECLICSPVEGMKFKIKVENITKAGIRGSAGGKNSPVDVFIARDHHYKHDYFNKVQEGNLIMIRVLGQRFEINDPKISVIAEMVKTRKTVVNIKSKKPKLVL